MTRFDPASAARLWRETQTIAQWRREAGTEDERRAAAYVAAQLASAGLTVTTLLHDAYISVPGEARLRVVAPAARDVPCITHSMAAATGADGRSAELVNGGTGSPAELAAAGAAGRFVLIAGASPSERAAKQAARHAEDAGALGVVFIGGARAQEMCVSPVWGNPSERTAHELAGIPLLSVARADGEALAAACAEGPVRIHATAAVRTGWTRTPIVIGDLAPGHPAADRDAYVLLSGHLDAWYSGAMDNAGANAAMLEIARVLAPRRASLRRGLRVAFWSGHSHGGYSSSAWYADHYWFDLERHCVMHVNVDVIGGAGADRLVTRATGEAVPLARWAMAEATGEPAPVDRVSRSNDESFWGIGVPSLFGEVSRQSDGTFGWWLHTVDDTPDKLDAARLLRDANVYLTALDRLLTDSVLPLDYASCAADLRGALASLAERSGGRFDLSSALLAASDLEARCRRLADAAAGSANAAAVNACLRDVGRILVPALYQGAGRFAHDSALSPAFLPAFSAVTRLAAAAVDSDRAQRLLVDLIRARNALVYALRRACVRVELLLAAAAAES